MWLLLQLIMRFPFLALHAERGDRGLSFPRPLSRQEEAALFVQMEQGTGEQKKAARDKLIEHNLRLVSHIVSKYARSGCGDCVLFHSGAGELYALPYVQDRR